MTPEQKARDMLERMGIKGAQEMTAGSLVELANLISSHSAKDKIADCTDLQYLSFEQMMQKYPGIEKAMDLALELRSHCRTYNLPADMELNGVSWNATALRERGFQRGQQFARDRVCSCLNLKCVE